MTFNTGLSPETFKEQCSSLASKFRRWPNLSDQDLLEIKGDIEKLVDRLVAGDREIHGQNESKEESTGISG